VDIAALQAAASAAQSLPYSGKKAVVVGAGPGSSDVSGLAHHLTLSQLPGGMML